jgi:hypothetical protein
MHKLVMRFLTSVEGKYFTLTVDDIKTDANGAAITEEQVATLMNLVVARNVFVSINGALTGKKDAKVVYTNTKEVNIA